nr:uncharacterized protein LOC117281887 isoform X2 [Nicotiana tomentosiformis]
MLRRKEKLAGNLFGKSCTFLARTKKRRKWRRRNRSCAFKEEKGFGIGSRSDFTECVDGCFSLWIGDLNAKTSPGKFNTSNHPKLQCSDEQKVFLV